ncbi:hypothetical protein ACJX0J_016372 [Zea mays]
MLEHTVQLRNNIHRSILLVVIIIILIIINMTMMMMMMMMMMKKESMSLNKNWSHHHHHLLLVQRHKLSPLSSFCDVLSSWEYKVKNRRVEYAAPHALLIKGSENFLYQFIQYITTEILIYWAVSDPKIIFCIHNLYGQPGLGHFYACSGKFYFYDITIYI